ncbi:unnamed protein product [Adineta steineri]|uniref:Uncharacterized protein n=1 Tax=Adineta steineri TaxID=433720 RepID=A0A816DUT4_9BILA|nr:unnamed protein product [Adineta steineri]CAF1640625.1 unnamed protein product [Adineta steineri]
MALTVGNQDEIDNGAHHLIKKRQSGCNCFSGFACSSDLYFDSTCSCMMCGSPPPPPRPTTRPTTTTTTTIDSARCNKICVGRRRTTRDRCPSCYSGAEKYPGGYYCCGGNSGSTCGGYFADTTCACRYEGTTTISLTNDCVAYDGGCGYFSSIKFDGACACFTCS